MGKARKSNKQKNDAKKANTMNMKFMEDLQADTIAGASSSSPTPIAPDSASSTAPQIDSDAEKAMEYLELQAITKPEQKWRGSAAGSSSADAVQDVGSVLTAADQSVGEPDILDLSVNTLDIQTITVAAEESCQSPAAQPIYAGREISVVKLVMEDGANRVVEEFGRPNALDDKLECSSCLAELNALKTLLASRESEIHDLKLDNAKYRSMNMRLQETLVTRPNGTSFKEVDGYPNAQWLLSVSQNAQDSDYLFVKELMFRLFPLGVGNATVTGHRSNNPFGRGAREGLELEPRENVERLDPAKVQYISDRLYERRMILQDELGVAQQRSRKTAKHIAAAINNNPSLRTQRLP